MSKNLHARDFLSSSALSLTLAGIFRDGGATAKERSGGGEEETVEISSENSGPGKTTFRPEEEDDSDELVDNDDEDQQHDHDCNNRNKKRKKYHRHTPEQIKEMEALFKECPHPDEKQRLQLSKQLGLHPRQVKFWFQNRRTQIKAIQERHENSLLRTEIDKLREENKALRDNIKTPSCSNCGFANCTTKAAITVTETEEQNLRTENAKLRAEVERLRSVIVKDPHGTSPHSSSYTSGNDQENTSSLEICTGNFVLEKSRIVDAAKRAMHEMVKMASHGDPLWIRSYESGREMLNYDEYLKEFCVKNSGKTQPQKSIIEASRESGVVFVDLAWLVQSFMDVNQWKQLFPCLVSKAATLDVICDGAGVNRDGVVQLMFAEIQMLTPMVATREVCFIRHCRQLSANRWAVADVSIDKVEDNIDVSTQKCRKLPSGCIIEDKSNGHCKVTWVEHLECQKSTVYSLYRTIVNNGLAFGAKHWISTLQQQCERLVFLVATNVPTKYSSGVATLAGRKSIMQLAQRMTLSFYKTVGASSRNSWNKITTKTGYEIRVASRQNLNDPGEPLGMILLAVTCVWLSVPRHVLFEFLGDESRRKEWDIMSNGSTVQTIANLAKGKDRGNAVTTLAMKTDEHTTWVLQDSSTNAYESTVVYAPVDVKGMQSVMTGCESSKFTVLPSGFSILPDGIESRPSVITSSWPEKKNTEGGSLLTVAFQILISSSPAEKLPGESLDSINTLISCTLQNIKKSLQCED